jgi:hypothetical protein
MRRRELATLKRRTKKAVRAELRARAAQLPPLPERVRMLVGEFRVEVVPRLLSPEGESCAGLCDWSARTIRIDAALDRTSAWLTLKHEWVHAVLADAGVMLPKGDSYENDLEERVCNTLALALVAELEGR